MTALQKKACPFLLLFFLTLSFSGQASHLVGGNLRYEYIGEFGGQHRYRIELTTYVNCDNNSQVPFPEPSHQIGVYEHDASNPNADKIHVTDVTVGIIDTLKIEPDNPPGCNVGEDACIRRGTFEATVDLPSHFDGYHLYFHRCCKNAGINNLANPSDEATGLHAFIPPTLVENSSPDFSDAPVPFICTGDTTTLLNTATDPDGDDLVFSFVDPYSSDDAVPGNPAPPPPDPLWWPIPTVNWAAGHNVNQPFGTGGHAFINASNGLTEYMIPSQGRWIVTVEIKEYRNGDLIGISRRDLQLLAIDCPGNPAPDHDPPSGTNVDTTIQEGDSLCYDIEFTDPNGDSIDLSAQGPIFDSSQVNPPAVIDTPASGDGNVSAQFCWGTDCGQGRALPYQFSVSATDNGCPPKTTDVVYEIEVEPPEEPDPIYGPDPVCSFDSGVVYSVDTIPGYTYDWSVSGGNLISGNGSDSIVVDWDSAGTGNIQVEGINANGCPSDPVSKNVTITGLPDAKAGPDTSICLGDSITIGGSPTAASGTDISWSPASNLNDDTLANPKASPSDTTQYIVTVSEPGACSNSDTMTLAIKNANMNAGPDTSICSGDTVQLHTGSADSADWDPGYALSDSTSLNPDAFPDSNISYEVFLYDSSTGCSTLDTVDIQVDSLPSVDAGPDTTICLNEEVMIGGSPTGPNGSDYLWDPSGSLDDSSLANPIASPSDTTVYTVSVNDTNGCQAVDSAEVATIPLPTANAGNDSSVCLGDSIQLNGSGGGNYSWSPTDSLSDPNIADPIAYPSDSTTYQLVVNDINGCSDTDSVDIGVNPLPVADAGPDRYLCPGDSVQLTGSGGGSYAWTPDSTIDDSTVQNPKASPSDTSSYILVVADSNGCTDMDTATVNVAPDVPVDAGTDTNICPGDSTIIGGSPTGPPGSSYTWSPSGSLDDPNDSNPIAFPSTDTTYIVTVTNDTCSNQDSVQVLLDTLPNVDAGPIKEACAGDSVQLDGSANGTPSWTPSSGLSDTTIENPLASPSDTSDYILTATDANGCSNSDSTTVNINGYPTATTSGDTGICRGDTALIHADGGSSYQWNPMDSLSDPNSDSSFAFPDSSTDYQVFVTDTNGCPDTASLTLTVFSLPPADAGNDTSICINDSAQLNASGGTSYFWSPSTGLNDPNIADPKASPSDTTSYQVEVTDSNACSSIDSVQVNVNPLPAVDAGNDTSFCLGDSVQLSASGASDHSWSPSASLDDPNVADPIASPDSSTTFYVTGTDSLGCSNLDSVRVTVHPLPPVDAGPDQEICRGDTATLVGSGADSFLWSPDTSISNTTAMNPQVWPDSTRPYYLEGTDTNGCVNQDTVQVNVYRVFAEPDSNICRGEELQLQAFGPNTTDYSWSPSTGLSDPNAQNPVAEPDSTTVYTITATDINGCVDQDSVEVEVLDNPDADLEASPKAECEGFRWNIQDRSQGHDSLFWSLGNEEKKGEEIDGLVAYDDEDLITQVVITDQGCRDTSTLEIDAPPFEEHFETNKPNVFTPNGDGKNDVFTLEMNGDYSDCVELRIFNRWGQLIFTSSAGNTRWDGYTSAGEKVSPGTYFYTLIVKSIKIQGELEVME